MNFFDTYELTTPATPNQPQQSLNEEVAEVIGQIGQFWGTFRKQSQTALEIARRDFSGVVNQAQMELNKLTTVSTESGSETSANPPDDDAATATNTPPAESNSANSSSSFFSRFQSVIPPNIASTVRSHLPETLKHASENLDFAQLQTKLMAELQRVQGLTRAQAEEYVHKSESLLREAVREAGVVIRDAVKIVPPEEAAGVSAAGAVWDGTDMWMLPSDSSTIDGSDEAAERDKTDRSMHQAVETERAVATRAEALVRRLKHDPSIVRHDPENDEALRDHFHSWITQEVEAKGGIEGPYWSQETAELLERESDDGPALQQTRDILVPSEMSQEIFWRRFFFRIHQITLEEERRKALIESTTGDSEEDLSWGEEEEEEEAGSPTTISPKKRDEFEVKGAQQLNVTRTSSWEGSEASYDVVSNGRGKGEDEDEESDWE